MASNPVSAFGGSGFLGRQIVRQLVAQGTSVRVAVRHPRDATFPEISVSEGQIEPICADVRDKASVAQAVEGTEAVVNSVGLYVERGDETFEAVHVRGAHNVARQTAQGGGAHPPAHSPGGGANQTRGGC